MRKPNPGMLLRAAELLSLNLPKSLMVGDKPSDIEAGRRAGLARLFLIGEDATPSDFSRIVADIELAGSNS